MKRKPTEPTPADERVAALTKLAAEADKDITRALDLANKGYPVEPSDGSTVRCNGFMQFTRTGDRWYGDAAFIDMHGRDWDSVVRADRFRTPRLATWTDTTP